MSATAQAIGYEIQGRRASNDVRLVTEQSRDIALTVAADMAAEGFTAWVFETSTSVGRKQYTLIVTVRPKSSRRK